MSMGQDLKDVQGLVQQRLDATPGTAYLIRPDQHVAGRWRQPTEAAVCAALATATAQQASRMAVAA
jgi:3-(3-hydroxy-phenyl)propionate hydroxylase